MKVKSDDMPRIASAVRLAGELLDAHGALVLDVVRDWQRGVRSTAAGVGATRWEDCTDPGCQECPDPTSERTADRLHFHARANDPTGESAVVAGADMAAGVFDELMDLLGRVFADCSRLNTITAGIVPGDTAVDPVRWCARHLEIGVCEPRHRGDRCRWCYEFELLHKRPPPLSLLGVKHRYGRVTKEQVDEALDADARRADTFTRVDAQISALRHIATPQRSTAPQPAEPHPVDTDPAVRLADALGKWIAAQETGSPRRIERAWRRYLSAHQALIDAQATDQGPEVANG